jgi:hypothetical protein
VSVALLGWELGAGYGHVSGLLQIAQALVRRGLQPVLALREVRGPWPLLRDCPFPVVQAPRLAARGDGAFVARSFADVLAASGFADEAGLASSLRAWDSLLELVRPAVVVTNHAPALALAAFGVVPVVVTGTGFTVPPGDEDTFPALVSGAAEVAAQGLVESVSSVLHRRGRPAPGALPELYRSDSYVLSVPELDPYDPVRIKPVAGPLHALPGLLSEPTSDEFFAYLSADAPWAEDVLLGMARVAPGAVYLRGAEAPAVHRLEAAGLRVLREAPPLSEVLAAAGVVVHHGSHATAQAALAAGRPQLCLPRHLEQSLTGHLLEQLGAGRSLRGELPPEAPGQALAELRSGSLARRAREVADAVQARRDVPSLEPLADRCAYVAAAG